ncbi:4-hydroxy-3-methylbut-2-enyl diphosphate reductase [Aquisphaera giovannonii]|uniref:4-hydroxy-3-methylbut-2-enyl diphosphate reductase n=1 Tax=Aquisphaera giovannonii TaxID=406548 RepID=A0A5B9W338_9BACT|nr:4-hydroxy-3-methylbut-2-enyl diphosphate reductase [Aquisphaera giovannonii]QEH34370.1 4-hydroxy-3-methylbut-2-enyl diphosphate reductase [Aquisphaera giovannonii]
MRVIRAEVLGMCFGVRDALKVVERIGDLHGVLIHGELVHNEVVLADLDRRGFAMRPEAERAGGDVPEARRVLITAHGISDRERRRLEAAGNTLIDTTCPLVLRVHNAARMLHGEGYHVLLVGRKGHVEVNGVVEDLERVDVIETPADVRDFGVPRLGLVCQTTAPESLVRELRTLVAERNPDAEVRFVDTVCQPTKEHQRALEGLLGVVDAVVVVGGRSSNNTRQLVDLCRRRGRPARQVTSAEELDRDWLLGFATVGLTAGTSTLDRTIDEVHRALVAIGVGRDGETPGEHPALNWGGLRADALA